LHSPVVSASGEAFSEMAAISCSDKNGGKTFYSPMPGSTFGFKIDSGDLVFGVISADVQLFS